jgi:hypothetical protein
MRQEMFDWDEIHAARARAQEVLLKVQHARWQAARARPTARLRRLALYMWRANSPTLAATAAIPVQRRLLVDRPRRAPMRGADIRPSPLQHLQPTHGP